MSNADMAAEARKLVEGLTLMIQLYEDSGPLLDSERVATATRDAKQHRRLLEKLIELLEQPRIYFENELNRDETGELIRLLRKAGWKGVVQKGGESYVVDDEFSKELEGL